MQTQLEEAKTQLGERSKELEEARKSLGKSAGEGDPNVKKLIEGLNRENEKLKAENAELQNQ